MAKFFYIFGGFIALFSLIFIGVGISMENTEARYGQDGVVAQGTITGKRMEEKRERRSGSHTTRTTKTYYLDYTFKGEDGRVHTGSDSIDHERWMGLNSGNSVEVQYLRGDGQTNRLAGSNDAVGGYIFMGIGGLLFLVGTGCIVAAYKRSAFVKRLLREGTIAEATVTRVGPSSVTINRVQQWQIHYSYRDYTGGQHAGTSEYMSPEAASKWREGDKGQIKFDQHQPSKSIWVGHSQATDPFGAR